MESIKIIINKWKDGTLRDIWEEWCWIYSYAKRYKKEIVFYIVLGLFGTVMGLGLSVVSKYMIDIVTGYDTSSLWLMIVATLGLNIFSLVFGSLNSRISLKINIRIQNDIQADIFDKIINVNWLDISKFHSGDILNRFSSDASTVAGSAIGWFPTVVTNVFSFVGAFALIMYYDPIMAAIALGSSPVLLLTSKYLMGRMRKYNEKLKIMNSEFLAFEGETFNNIDSVKSFDLVPLFSRKLRDFQKRYKDISLELNTFSIKTNIWMTIIGNLVSYACFGWGIYQLWTGRITYGTMTLFLNQAGKLSSAFSALVGVVPSTISSTMSARRIMDIVELPKEVREKEDTTYLQEVADKGFGIKLEDVFFAYVEDKQVLTSSSLIARPNEIVALVGPSGEGKTTLIRMFLGLIVPNDGTAMLVDCNGDEIALGAATRRFFAYVPQGNSIFSGSIADNLRMVKEDATDEELIEALKIACAYDFVMAIPEGINGKLGEKGRGLSEGQAQRIAIARAVLCDAPVLLLDEATSALDVATERKVLKNIIQQRPNKTCIVTTHRPSVLNMCQRVYRVMDTKITQLDEEESSRMAMDF